MTCRAVAQVHVQPRKPHDAGALEQIPEHLLLAAGDDPERQSYFDFKVEHGEAGVALGRGVALADYRTREGKRTHRSMITVPPSLHDRIARLAPGQPWSTALIALADYAALHLVEEGKTLHVAAAEDEDRDARRRARRLLVQRGLD